MHKSKSDVCVFQQRFFEKNADGTIEKKKKLSILMKFCPFKMIAINQQVYVSGIAAAMSRFIRGNPYASDAIQQVVFNEQFMFGAR